MAITAAELMVRVEADTKALESGLGQAEKKVDSFGSQLGKLAAGAAVGGLAAIGAASFKMSDDFATSTAQMQAQFGLTGDAARELGDVAKSVFKDNFGSSLADAAQSVGLVRQQLGDMPSDALKTATENALRLKDTFGTDVGESISATKTLMDNFGLSSTQAFDLVTAGFQKGLNRSGDFLESITEYGTQFGNGGATAEQFFSVLQSGLQGGVLGTDKAADAFKEFRVRIQDGSKLTSDSLKSLGIDSEQLAADMASGQVTAAQAFQQVTDKLREQTDQNVIMQAGVGLLGTQFEDLGTKGALGLTLMSGAFDDVSGKTAALDVQYRGWGNTFETLKRAAIVDFLLPLGDRLGGVASAAGPAITASAGLATGFAAVAPALAPVIAATWAHVTALTAQAAALVVANAPLLILIGAIALVAAGIVLLVKYWDDIPDAVRRAGSAIQEFVSGIPDAVGNIASMVGNAMSAVGSAVMDFITGAVPQIAGAVAEWGVAFVEWVAPRIGPMIDQAGELLSSLIDWATGTALPGIVSAVEEWGTAVVEWVAPRIGPLLAEAGALLARLGEWMVGTALPAIISNVTAWGQEFVTWVAPRVVALMSEMQALQNRLVTWMAAEALPAIVAKLVEWGTAFVQWVATDVLPKLPGALAEILTAIGTWVTGTAVPWALGALRSVGGAIVQGIQDGISAAWGGLTTWLGQQASSLAGTVRSTVTGALDPRNWKIRAVGVAIVDEVTEGVAQQAPVLRTMVSSVVGRAMDDGVQAVARGAWAISQAVTPAADAFRDLSLDLQRMIADLARQFDAGVIDAQQYADGVKAALDSIPKTITVNTTFTTTGAPVGGGGATGVGGPAFSSSSTSTQKDNISWEKIYLPFGVGVGTEQSPQGMGITPGDWRFAKTTVPFTATAAWAKAGAAQTNVPIIIDREDELAGLRREYAEQGKRAEDLWERIAELLEGIARGGRREVVFRMADGREFRGFIEETALSAIDNRGITSRS